MRRTIIANDDFIESLCDEVHRLLSQTHHEEADFVCDLLLRELLLNAICHGCRDLPESFIDCKISLLEQGVQITIKDPGPGFSWKKSLGRKMSVDSDSGRGLLLIKKYAYRLRFNAGGNCVSIKIKFV
jgi:serine/threonine-protein kinase RsbW